MPVGRYSLLLTAEKFLDERARPQKSRIESAVERNWDGSDEQRTNVGDGDGVLGKAIVHRTPAVVSGEVASRCIDLITLTKP